MDSWERNEHFFGLKKAIDIYEWIEERRKLPDIEEKIQEWVEIYRVVYEKEKIEYDGEGELSYNEEKGEKLWNDYGADLRGYLTDV